MGTWLKDNFDCRGEDDFNCALTFGEMRDEYLSWYYQEVSTITPNINANTFTKKLRGLFGNFHGMVKKTVDGVSVRRYLLIRKEKYDDDSSGGDVLGAEEQDNYEVGARETANLFDEPVRDSSEGPLGLESDEGMGSPVFRGE